VYTRQATPSRQRCGRCGPVLATPTRWAGVCSGERRVRPASRWRGSTVALARCIAIGGSSTLLAKAELKTRHAPDSYFAVESNTFELQPAHTNVPCTSVPPRQGMQAGDVNTGRLAGDINTDRHADRRQEQNLRKWGLEMHAQGAQDGESAKKRVDQEGSAQRFEHSRAYPGACTHGNDVAVGAHSHGRHTRQGRQRGPRQSKAGRE